MVKIDDTDLKILRILQEDGSTSNIDLSKQIGLSPAPTLERVKKLEKNGVIKQYHADVDPKTLGLGCTTFISVTLNRHRDNHIERFLDQVSKLKEIVECHHVTGSSDYLLKVITTDIGAFEHFLTEKLTGIEEVGRLQTSVVLSTVKESKVLPIKY